MKVATSSFIVVPVPRTEFLWCCWCTIERLLKRFQSKELQCQLQCQNMCWLSRPTLLQWWQISRIHSCCRCNSKLTGVKFFVGVYSGQILLATKSGSGVKTRKKHVRTKKRNEDFVVFVVHWYYQGYEIDISLHENATELSAALGGQNPKQVIRNQFSRQFGGGKRPIANQIISASYPSSFLLLLLILEARKFSSLSNWGQDIERYNDTLLFLLALVPVGVIVISSFLTRRWSPSPENPIMIAIIK